MTGSGSGSAQYWPGKPHGRSYTYPGHGPGTPSSESWSAGLTPLVIITCFQFSFICCFWANEKSENNYMRFTPSVYVRRVARGRRTYVMFLWSNVMFQDFNSIALPLSLLPVDLNCFIMWTWRIGQCYFRLKSMSLNDKRHTLNVLGKSFNTAGQGFGFLCRSLLPHQ